MARRPKEKWHTSPHLSRAAASQPSSVIAASANAQATSLGLPWRVDGRHLLSSRSATGRMHRRPQADSCTDRAAKHCRLHRVKRWVRLHSRDAVALARSPGPFHLQTLQRFVEEMHRSLSSRVSLVRSACGDGQSQRSSCLLHRTHHNNMWVARAPLPLHRTPKQLSWFQAVPGSTRQRLFALCLHLQLAASRLVVRAMCRV